MSATPSKNAEYPHGWFQPVRYDLDAYRQFAAGLDDSLAQLLADHPVRRTQAPRSSLFSLHRQDTVESHPENPPEQRSC